MRFSHTDRLRELQLARPCYCWLSIISYQIHRIRGGRYGKNIIPCFFFQEISRFTILSRFFVMLVLLFCKLSEQYSQTKFPIIKTFKLTKKEKNKEWQIFIIICYIYITLFWILKALYIEGGISSTTTNVQHPPGGCDGSHIAPERPPHTSLLVERRQSDEANQCMGMIRRLWWSKANLG